ncbi:putative cytochrome P450 [Rhypophila decipiens]
MMASVLLPLLSLTIFIFFWASRAFSKYLQYEQKRVQFGCQPLRRYRSWDMILGLDYVYSMMKAIKEDRFFEFQKQTYHTANGDYSRVWTANFLGNRMVYSSASENMKAMSTSRKDCFGIEPIRVTNGAVGPFTPGGVSSSDGAKWHRARDLIKPYFDRAAFSNLDRLQVHVDRLLNKIPSDGTTVDMQSLFQRWFLDTSTEFLFGKSANSLDNPDMAQPQRDMVTAMAGLRLRLQLSSFMFLHRDKEWLAACNRINTYLDTHIDQAYSQVAEEKLGEASLGRDDLLWSLARLVPDKTELRAHLLGVWVPSNETTSILMSNTIFALARHPHVVQKLREEVLAYGDKRLTFEGLRSLSYLRWTINETHRLYPVSLQTVRACVKDTILPTGGGDNGKAPVFCAQGDILHCNRYLMHRDPEVWGADAETFRPERWAEARPLWNFVPYGGGPRMCPAHVMVDTECSFVLFRILQRFRAIEARDSKPYKAVMRVGPSNKNGCKVGFVAA